MTTPQRQEELLDDETEARIAELAAAKWWHGRKGTMDDGALADEVERAAVALRTRIRELVAEARKDGMEGARGDVLVTEDF